MIYALRLFWNGVEVNGKEYRKLKKSKKKNFQIFEIDENVKCWLFAFYRMWFTAPILFKEPISIYRWSYIIRFQIYDQFKKAYTDITTLLSTGYLMVCEVKD